MDVVFGTNNPAKVDDIRKLIKNSDIVLKTLADLNLKTPDIKESGQTFEENARIKYGALRGLVPDDKLLVTEDSGIEIDALGGEPGVHARRWSPDGRELTDEEIVDKTLKLLRGKQNRTARFVSALAFGGAGVSHQTVRGELIGNILEEPDHKGMIPGFPYRALFYVPQIGKMLYEIHDIPLEQRQNTPTHREKAWQQLETAIREREKEN